MEVQSVILEHLERLVFVIDKDLKNPSTENIYI